MLKLSLKKIQQLIPLVLSATLLVACGGGDDAPAPAQTLSGVAAVGVPIVGGTVNISCSAGSGFSATTGGTGEWSVNTSGQTLPCAVQVSGGTVGGAANATSHQSIAISFGNINVTPLTSLVVAQLTGSNPVSWFRTPVFTGVNADNIAAAVRSVSTSLGLTSTLGSINPLTDTFKAQNGDKMDDILEALKAALASASKTYADLLAAASSRNYAAFTGFGSSFSSAYATITVNASGGGSGAGSTCSAGQTLMVFSGGGGGLFTNGQKVCFTATPTSLAFSGKTLGNPVQNTVVSAPYSAYKFTDGALAYEVIFKANAATNVIYEINVFNGSTFVGQFTPDTSATGGVGSGAYKLTVEVSVSGVAGAAVVINGVPKPANEAEFCSEMKDDSSLTQLTASGGTLTINSCSFSGNVGTISATLTTSVPVSLSVPYTVKYTYSN
ncbi:MAG: hypothetical protein V4772_28160 [Pseudomonadota bacterium]